MRVTHNVYWSHLVGCTACRIFNPAAYTRPAAATQGVLTWALFCLLALRERCLVDLLTGSCSPIAQPSCSAAAGKGLTACVAYGPITAANRQCGLRQSRGFRSYATELERDA